MFIVFNMTSTIISFFSVGNIDRLEATENLLKFGSSWNTWLSVFPVLLVTACLSVPGPQPEKFGTGSQRVKVAMLYLASLLLITGQSIRLYAVFNKELPGTTNVLYGKAVFYTTGFMFEIIVVALYAALRVDLRFHIPNGASGPGDYSGDKNKGQYSVEEIERLIDDLEIPHQIMRERKGPDDMEMVFTIFFATKKEKEAAEKDIEAEAALPDRAKRITRRQTIIDAIKQPPRPMREPTEYPEVPDIPDIPTLYAQMGGELPPRRPMRPSMYGEYEQRQTYNSRDEAQYQEEYWGGSYGNEKGGMRQ